MWYIRTIEHYFPGKGDEALIHDTACMNLENIQSEKSHKRSGNL